MKPARNRLVFSLLDSVYAIKAQCVCEVVWLPEPTAHEEAPPHILRLGHGAGRYALAPALLFRSCMRGILHRSGTITRWLRDRPSTVILGVR